MFFHQELEQRLFQAGLEASKTKFSQDEVPRRLARLATTPASHFDPKAPFVTTDTPDRASDCATREEAFRLQNASIAVSVITALARLQEEIGNGLGYGMEVTRFVTLATSYEALSTLGLSTSDLLPLREALEATASRLEVARLLQESSLAVSGIKPAFDDGFRLTFKEGRPALEQLTKAIPGTDDQYWVLTARRGYSLPQEANEEIWRFSATSYQNGEEHTVTSAREVTLSVALLEYASLRPPEPESSLSFSR